MKTKGALLAGPGRPWTIDEIEIGEPRAGEVKIRMEAAGLCQADQHLVTGDITMAGYPVLGGHEGAGVVVEVGTGIFDLSAGDHVVTSFVPSCGTCPPCRAGLCNLCDLGAGLLGGRAVSDGTYRITANGREVYPMALVGTFAPYAVVHRASVVKIDPSIPFEVACLVGCDITTGYGSAVHTARIRPGDDVAIIGLSGVGASTLQGAVLSGARRIFVVEPVEWKRKQAEKLGATEVFADIATAVSGIADATAGHMCHKVIAAIGRRDSPDVEAWLELTAKAGTCVLTAVGRPSAADLPITLPARALLQKNVQGSLFGGGSPRDDIPEVLALYKLGDLDLGAALTKQYRLEQINAAYDDIRAGHDLRGIIRYDDSDH
ncbi:NDMA-dependent alcohol dehydrogenase [Nocardia cyriacigeorgica]|uniref:alcohol dehydrogenase n=1 Tax=Nocardia cyriacigeorgica TaxID=135487 RepID=A0A5R8P9F1_9NOCA|nr:NDMA-dependent alcohol dehydrogenase [Nocardia cyriacigeorgica]TLF98273.1 NDMA-dependent alcohol dehydrogenase [Nocardia cyriacigeorgica]